MTLKENSGLHNVPAAPHQGLAFQRQVSSFSVLPRRAHVYR